jgi:hypothetical protein
LGKLQTSGIAMLLQAQKVYLETTLFNYYFDTTRNAQPATVAFFEAIGASQFEGYTSVYTYLNISTSLKPKR